MTKKNEEEETALATYGEWTHEQMEKESSEMSTGGDFWKAPVGNTTVRLLPPKLGWKSPFTIQHQHFVPVPGAANKIIFSCPRMHLQQKCLVCLKADQLEESGNSKDVRMAKELRPNKRMLANAVVNVTKEGGGKLVVWTFGKTVYDQMRAIRESEEGGGNFLDPIKGFNLVVNRVGSGRDDTEYKVIPARNATRLGNMEWIEMQEDLSKLVRIPTVEQQKRLLDGEDPRDVWGDPKVDRAHGSLRKRDDASDIDTSAIDAASTDKKKSPTAEDDLFDNDLDLD